MTAGRWTFGWRIALAAGLAICLQEAVMAARLERAQRLLRETALTISDIAADVGYASPSNFSRDYRRAFGSTPAETRRQLRERAAGSADGRSGRGAPRPLAV